MGRIKEWEELTISDNFLFQKVMQNPKICKKLVEKLLRIKIKNIVYPTTEMSIEESPTQKGIRLDLYVETDTGVIIDIEMQTTNDYPSLLPKRTRYYQSLIDLNVLRKSQDYTELKKSFVIFICTFDPFPKNKLKLYTFTNRCHEKGDIDLEDDAVKIFLNTKGKFGKVDKDIDKFLAYIDGKAAEGKFTKDIAAEAERIKQHKETRLEYMTLMAELQDQRREGENSGRIKNIINNVRSLMKKKGWSLDEAFDVLDVSPKDRAAAIAGL